MDITPDYDVIIIGSGPAGCAAAITCTQSALTVLIITDTDCNQNSVVIVESVHSGISFLLLQLKGADSLSKASIGEYEGIESGGIEVDLGGDENGVYVGHHIHRGAFDASLFQTAIQQGVQVRVNEKVNDLLFHNDYIVGLKINSGEEILSRYVIDASGNRRFAGKKLKFRETFFSPPLACWTGISFGMEKTNPIFKNRLTKFIPHQHGWIWLAPILPDKCGWTQLSVKGSQSFLPPEFLKKYSLFGPIKKANMRWRLFRPVCREGVILCGDAAGVLDPAAGQGILNSLYSGIKAAQGVIACLQRPEYENIILAQYDDWFHKQYVSKMETLSEYYRKHGIDVLSHA